MGDFKSKLPNLQEVASYAGKLFKDVKSSVCEIVDQYKKNRVEEEKQVAEKNASEVVSSSKKETNPNIDPSASKPKTTKTKRKNEDDKTVD